MIELDIKYSTGEMEKYRNTLPMKEPWDVSNLEFLHTVDTYLSFAGRKKKCLMNFGLTVTQLRNIGRHQKYIFEKNIII